MRSVIVFKWMAVCCVAVGLLACRTPVTNPSREASAMHPSGSRDGRKAITPPPAVRDALLPPLEMARAGSAGREPRFDVAVKEAPARNFFLDLVDDTPYDMVVHPGVKGSISLSLRDATVPQILESVRAVYGYGYRATATGFYVLPAEIQARVFQVDYLHAMRKGESETRVSAGELSESSGGAQSSSGNTTTTGGGRGGSTIESSRVRTESDADLWKEVATAVQSIVGAGEGRSVVVSPQAGIVVVRARPDELLQVEEYLSNVTRNLRRQVILDAKILEVELDDGFRSGINWAQLVASGTKSALFGHTGGGSLLESGVSEIGGNSGLLDPRALLFPSNTDTSAFGGVFSAAVDLGKLTAFVELLETQGEVHVLSSPRISTMNNQKAVIKVGNDEFFVTDVSTTTVTGNATTTSPDVTLTPFFSGVVLDVLPQISAEGDVLLHVHPSVSQVTDQTKTISLGFDEPLELPLAFSTIRETDTIVRARNGQVVVIGGLMQDSGRYDRASIPLLGRIPWIGKHLFGQQQDSSRKSELVILLRPTVVDDSTWADDYRRTEKRMQAEAYSERSRRVFGVGDWAPQP